MNEAVSALRGSRPPALIERKRTVIYEDLMGVNGDEEETCGCRDRCVRILRCVGQLHYEHDLVQRARRDLHNLLHWQLLQHQLLLSMKRPPEPEAVALFKTTTWGD
ncbi:MAG: hypothetical protein ACK53K_05905 [Burkholderiales bacterium]